VQSGHTARAASLGMRVFVAADAVTFAALIAVAVFARGSGAWRAPGDPAASAAYGAVLTALLVGASAVLLIGRRARWSHAAAAACGLGFVIAGLLEWRSLAAAGLAPGNSRFADFFFVITGYHMAHVAAGVVALVAIAARGPARRGPAMALSLYWHFVDAVWIAIFLSLYL
jgi:cytochrome c oxidase subunit 3